MKSLWYVLVLACLVFNLPARAAIDEEKIPTLGNEPSALLQKSSVYLLGDQNLDDLVPVRVLGAVQKAGIHYVPKGTDLITLLSAAGGPTEHANMNKISIKRTKNGKAETFTVSLENIIEKNSATVPTLQQDDTVVIYATESFISDDALRTMSIVTGVAAVVIAVSTLRK